MSCPVLHQCPTMYWKILRIRPLLLLNSGTFQELQPKSWSLRGNCWINPGDLFSKSPGVRHSPLLHHEGVPSRNTCSIIGEFVGQHMSKIRFYPKFCGEFVGEICEISGHQLFVGLSNRRGTRKELAPSMPWTPHALRAAGWGWICSRTRTSLNIQIDIPTYKKKHHKPILIIITDTCRSICIYEIIHSYIIAIMMYG